MGWNRRLFAYLNVALEHGLASKEEAVAGLRSRLKEGGGLVVAWGELGAASFHPAENNGEVFSCPAAPPQGGVLDTLGAGDTFNAAVIGGLAAGLSLSKSVSLKSFASFDPASPGLRTLFLHLCLLLGRPLPCALVSCKYCTSR